MTFYMSNADFAKIKTIEDCDEFFEKYYPSAVPLMPELKLEFMKNPVGFLGTVFCSSWVYGDKLALMGDAAHAVTPFFGQGCNCGFEDVSIFDDVLTKHEAEANTSGSGSAINMEAVFADYFNERKANGDAIGNMALENFTEMMSTVSDPKFLLEKEIEVQLSNNFPIYTSRLVIIRMLSCVC